MIITGLHDTATCLLDCFDIDPNKLGTNNNLVLLYYKIKYGKQYAFLTDQYCVLCIYYCNQFKSTLNDVDISQHINNFAHHVLFHH